MVGHAEPKAILIQLRHPARREKQRVRGVQNQRCLDGLLVRVREHEQVFLDLYDVLEAEVEPVVCHLAKIFTAVPVQIEQSVVVAVTTRVGEEVELRDLLGDIKLRLQACNFIFKPLTVRAHELIRGNSVSNLI